MSADGEVTASIPCGVCVECLRRRSFGWTFRMLEECKVSSSVAFTTFTYDDEHLPFSENGFPTLRKKDFQDFIKRLRHKVAEASPKLPKLKYYMCGEYGTETFRPHYHAIMYNLPINFFNDFEILQGIWQNGFIDIQPPKEGAFVYVTKYVMKNTFKAKEGIVDTETGEIIVDDREKEFSLMSKNLGANFLTPQMIKYLKDRLQSYVNLYGYRVALPRYYRDKIFTTREKKIMSDAAAEAREANFIEYFNSDYRQLNEVIKDKIRKHQKEVKLERVLL